MSTYDVIMGATYLHDETQTVMRLYSASVPELDDQVRLIEPDGYGKWNGFYRHWLGSWDDFKDEWTERKQEEEDKK